MISSYSYYIIFINSSKFIDQNIQASTMIKKKNYKQEEHFSTTFSMNVLSQSGKRHLVYYKRYRNSQSNNVSVYELMNNAHKNKNTESKKKVGGYSQDRTLELITFDGSLSFLKSYLRKVGKIRIFDVGEALYQGQTIHYALCVFKFQFDLVKCFRDDYLQHLVQEQSKGVNVEEEERQTARYELIKDYMGKQLQEKAEKLDKLQEDGFQVVTDIYGQYRMDYEANKKFVEDLPQEKKRKKLQQKKIKLSLKKQQQLEQIEQM